MPLSGGCSVTAFRRNISELVSKGYPQDQAVAIAMDKLKSSCKEAKKPLPDIGEIVPPEWEDELIEIVQTLLASEDEEAEKADVPLRPTGVWGIFDYDREGSKKDDG